MRLPEVIAPDGSQIDVKAALSRPKTFLDSFVPGGISSARADQKSRVLGFVWAILEQQSFFVPDDRSSQLLEGLSHSGLVNSGGQNKSLIWFSSSGSTGVPKLIGHSSENLMASARKISNQLPDLGEGTFPTLFPANYMAGLLNCVLVPWLSGGRILLTQPFNAMTPRRMLAYGLGSERIIAWLSPTMIRAFLARPSAETHVRRWTRILSATGPLLETDWVIARRRWGIPITNTYGSTEQLFIALNDDDQYWRGVGFPLSGVRLTAPNKPGRRAPAAIRTDTPAQLLISPENDGFRRLENPLQTADLAEVRQDGAFDLVGRVDDVVVLGGKNTDLARYEKIPRQVPGVSDALACVKAFDSPRDIHVIVEAVASRDKEELLEALWETFRRDLPAEDVPGRIEISQIPRLPNGKVDRACRKAIRDR